VLVKKPWVTNKYFSKGVSTAQAEYESVANPSPVTDRKSNQGVERKGHPSLWLAMLLVAIVWVVYGRVLGHEFLLTWDDRLYVVHCQEIQGFSWEHIRTVFTTYYVGNYAPVQMLSYMLDYEMWGLTAGGFLFTNILLHTLNGLLLFKLFLALHSNRLIALIGTAFFLLHPVQVESVAWISQRKNLLAMLFFLAAWHSYCQYRKANNEKRWPFYTASIVFFVLAVLSKSVAVVFPAVMLLYDICFAPNDKSRRFLDKIPYVLIASVVVMFTMLSQVAIIDEWGGGDLGGGRVSGFHGGSIIATVFTMLPVFCRYLGMLVWPVDLSAVYLPPIHHAAEPAVIAAALLITVIGMLCTWLYRVNRQFGFWPMLVVVCILPVSQIVPLVTLMNDRYLYFPLLGAAALVGVGGAELWHRFGVKYHWLIAISLALPLALLAACSFQRTAVWKNDVTFNEDVVTKSPNTYRSWEALGEAYYFALPQQTLKAQQAYLRALELYPTSMLTLYNLGVLYIEMGEIDKGNELLTKLVALNPNHAMGWAYLGNSFRQMNQYPEAADAFLQALALQPDNRQALLWLGELYLLQKQTDQARMYYGRLASIDPDSSEVAFQMACVEALAGQSDRALVWLEKSFQLGYRDRQSIMNCRELALLHDSARFKNLLQQYFRSSLPLHSQ
jgi:tetratricopeptide (TPR) repeat protein